jgi:single-stranded-DNA-specific exonuclease
MKKKWNIKIDGRGLEQDEIIDSLLSSRNIDNVGEFLHPSEEDILPLEKLHNIDKAAQMILDGVENLESFYVYYDVDVDGCGSGSIATRYLNHLGADVTIGINNWKEHGIKNTNIDDFDGIDILWIVDSIQDSIEPYKKFLDKDIKIVISDHHIVSNKLAKEMEEVGIILVSSAYHYENPDLSGSCVTWKVCKMIDELCLDDYADSLIDLAATGLIADMCNMMSPENRAICDKAFKNLRNPGIKKINGSYAFVARNVSFGVSPKINAANRVNHNDLAMKVFLSDDEDEIAEIVKGLNQCREEQNKIVDEIMPNLEEQAQSQLDKKCMFFFIPDNIKAAVSGLVANRLLERYSRPLCVLKKCEDEYSGSMRATGVKSFKKYCDNTGIGWCSGHENAAGIGIPIAQLDEFKKKIEEELADIEFVCETSADIQLDAEQVTDNLIKSLNALNRISGTGFEPITVMVETDNYSVSSMSGGKHVKIIDNETEMIFVKWNYNGDWDFDGTFKAIGTLENAHYGRNNYKQLTIQDFKLDKSEKL